MASSGHSVSVHSDVGKVKDVAMMRVGVSLLAAKPGLEGGLGTYIRAIAQALAARSSERYVFFAPSVMFEFWANELPTGATLIACSVNSRIPELRAVYESVVLPTRAVRAGCDIMYYPHLVAPLRRMPKAVVTVHDVMHLTQPAGFSWYKRLYLRASYQRLVAGATTIVTASEFCRRQLTELLGISPDRINVVLSGVDEAFSANRLGVHPPDAPRGQYLLSVAAAYPHKRLPLLVRAFELTAGRFPSLRLLFVGLGTGLDRERERLNAAINRSAVRDRIVILDRLPWDQLPALYRGAVALVHSSAFEGFGLPIAEAMVAGTPVVASPAVAVVEILAGHGTIAAGWGEEGLSSAIESVLQWSPSERAQRLRVAQDYARGRFAWDGAAEALAGTFRRLAGAPSGVIAQA